MGENPLLDLLAEARVMIASSHTIAMSRRQPWLEKADAMLLERERRNG